MLGIEMLTWSKDLPSLIEVSWTAIEDSEADFQAVGPNTDPRTPPFFAPDALWLIQSTIGTWGEFTVDHKAHQAAIKLDKVWSDALVIDQIEMRSYSCYVDPAIPGDWKTLYYGDSIPRLEALKSQIDPTNLFRNPQSLNVKERNHGVGKLTFNPDVHPLP